MTPTSGTSLSTLFTLSASGWQSTELPMTYQFWFRLNYSKPEFFPLGGASVVPKFVGSLIGGPTAGNIEVRVDIIDGLNVEVTKYANVSLTAFDPDTTSFVSQVSSHLSVLRDDDIETNIALLASFAHSINIIYGNMNLSQSELNDIVRAKYDIILALEHQYSIANSESDGNAIMNVLTLLSENINLNTIDSLEAIAEAVENTFHVWIN